MRGVLAAYALVATLAWGSGGALADDLDGWCSQIKKASSIVICSDAELRQEAIARNKLFDVARAKLNPEAYKALTKEQAQWIKAYTARCGVSTDDPPPAMPIAQSVVDCYRRESRARTAYLAAHLGPPNLVTAGANPSLDYSGLKPLDYSGHPFDQFGATSGSAMAEDRGEISLVEANGVYKVPVIINNVLPLQFVLDSGSGDVSLPEDVFSVLRRTGTITSEDYIGTGNYQLADGSTVQSDRFNIRELKVGAHVIKHVSASIGDKRGPLLLGQSFLKRFASVEIDNTRHVLTIGAERSDTNEAAALPPLPPGAQVVPDWARGPPLGAAQPTSPGIASPIVPIDISKLKLTDVSLAYGPLLPNIFKFIVANAGSQRVSELIIGYHEVPGRCTANLSDYDGFKKFSTDHIGRSLALTAGDSVVLETPFSANARGFCIISAR